jgi:polyisoprenoid-binding protein YceI
MRTSVIRAVLAAACAHAALAGPARAQSATLASLTHTTGLPLTRLDVDWPHSAVEFSVRFMGLSTVRGAFASFGGTLMYDSVDVARSTISVVIQTASINTNVAFRDRHLRSPDFFDAEKYPVITFHSERVTPTPTGAVVSGPLSMHGVTRTVDIAVHRLHPLATDAWSNRRVGFEGTLTLKRSDYGIKGTSFWNSEFDPGRMSISDDVEISLLVSAKASNVDRWTNAGADSLVARIDSSGIAPALATFRARLADSSDTARVRRAQLLDNAAAKLMQHGRFAESIAVSELLAATAVQSGTIAAALAGAAEGRLMLGQRDAAIRGFEAAAKLDAQNTVAAEYLRHLGRREAAP